MEKKKEYKPKKKKIDEGKKKKLKDMNKKYVPIKGFTYSKKSTTSKKSIKINYTLRGDILVLNNVKNNFYNAVSMVSENIMFEYAQIGDSEKYILLIINKDKQSNLSENVRYASVKYPSIEIELVMDNKLEIRLDFENDGISYDDVEILYMIEYVLDSVEKNWKLIVKNERELINIFESNKNIIDNDNITDELINYNQFYFKSEDVSEKDEK